MVLKIHYNTDTEVNSKPIFAACVISGHLSYL